MGCKYLPSNCFQQLRMEIQLRTNTNQQTKACHDGPAGRESPSQNWFFSVGKIIKSQKKTFNWGNFPMFCNLMIFPTEKNHQIIKFSVLGFLLREIASTPLAMVKIIQWSTHHWAPLTQIPCCRHFGGHPKDVFLIWRISFISLYWLVNRFPWLS